MGLVTSIVMTMRDECCLDVVDSCRPANNAAFRAAVQKERGSDLEVKGELFGLQNLLRFSVDCLDSLENLRARRHATSNYCIEQYDPEDLGESLQHVHGHSQPRTSSTAVHLACVRQSPRLSKEAEALRLGLKAHGQ